jgi:hypothetical protein
MQVFLSILSQAVLHAILRDSGWQAGIAGPNPASVDVSQRCYSKATMRRPGIAKNADIADIKRPRPGFGPALHHRRFCGALGGRSHLLRFQ